MAIEQKPLISVIVPVYKVEDCLELCVDSILGQTFTDFELILIDDGSPDNCGAICDEYAAKDSRVRVIHRENGGLSAARNSGMDIAVGEYITFIDSDDAVTEDFLGLMLNAVKDGDIAVCAFSEFHNDVVPSLQAGAAAATETVSGKKACMEIYTGSRVPVNACAKLFRRSLFDGICFPEGRLHEDQATVPIVCYAADKVVSVKRGMYLYRTHPESITRSKFTLKRYDDIWAIDKCIEFFEEKNENEIVNAARKKRKILLSVYSIYARRDNVKVPKQYRIGRLKAVRILRKNVSPQKFEYYIGQISRRFAVAYEYWRKIKSIIRPVE